MSSAPSPEQRFYNTFHSHGLDQQRAGGQYVGRRGDPYYCIIESLPNAATLSAVEWGFGSIARGEALNRLFRSYHALDISASMFVGNEKVPFTYSDVNLNEDLPFDDATFDVSIAMMIIEHLFDPFHSFREIARTTKRSGHVFVQLPLVSSYKNRLRVLFGGLPVTSRRDWWALEAWDGGHLHYFTIPIVVRLAEHCGLEFKRLFPVNKHLALKRLWPSLLCDSASFVFQRRA